MKTQSLKYMATGIVVLILMGLFFSCGKKGPPLPPDREGVKFQAPYDLACEIKSDTAIVTWKHDPIRAGSPVTLSGFDIFLARVTTDDCVGCPVIFEKIDTVGPGIRAYSLPVLAGSRYYIRIMAVGTRNITSEYSRTFQFEF